MPCGNAPLGPDDTGLHNIESVVGAIMQIVRKCRGISTDARAELAALTRAPATVSADGTMVSADLTGDLLLNFSLAGDGAPQPLAEQTIAGVQFTITAELVDDQISGGMTGMVDGQFFSWTDLVTLHDLRITMDGAEP